MRAGDSAGQVTFDRARHPQMDPANRPQRPRRRDRDDDDFPLAVAPARPLIEPGLYDAKSTSVFRDRMFDRYVLRIPFRIFDGPYVDGVVLAEDVDGFFPLGNDKKRPGPSSKIARLVGLLDPNARLDHLMAKHLKDKLWRVEVVTVVKDREGKNLHAANQYSRVADVLERLA